MAEIVERTDSPVAAVTGPVYLLLLPIPVVCFVGALLTDLVYMGNAVIEWLNFSEWLIAAGLVFGAFAALASLIELIAAAPLRSTIVGWGHIFLFWAAMIVELFNAFVHSVDGWTAVVPTGLILSIIGSILAVLAVATLFFVPVAWVPAREEVRHDRS
jgi:uncharacterized membrane protein